MSSAEPMNCTQMSPMSSASTTYSSSVLSPPLSSRPASRLSSSFRRRNPVTGEGCISKDMMIWGGGVGAKKLIGCDGKEDLEVKGYQRPRKVANLRKGIKGGGGGGEPFIQLLPSFGQ